MTPILNFVRQKTIGEEMYEKYIQVDRFTFEVNHDPAADAVCAIEVMVFFSGEPCCDDNGHQYRFYLPAGLREESLKDLCSAFTKAVHCEHNSMAA